MRSEKLGVELVGSISGARWLRNPARPSKRNAQAYGRASLWRGIHGETAILFLGPPPHADQPVSLAPGLRIKARPVVSDAQGNALAVR